MDITMNTRSKKPIRAPPAVLKDAAVQTDDVPDSSSSSKTESVNESEYSEYSEEEEEEEEYSEYSDESEESGEEAEEEEEEEEPQQLLLIMNGTSAQMVTIGGKKRARGCCGEQAADTNAPQYTDAERAYWSEQLDKAGKKRVVAEEKRVATVSAGPPIPTRFKILLSDKDPKTKSILLRKLTQISTMNESSGEYHKIKNWIEAACRLPLGEYIPIPVNALSPVDKVGAFLQTAKGHLDDTVFGHKETKEQIVRILAQWIANPGSKGNCIGIQGPAGIGKTSLFKDGICKALGLPFQMISLGGAADGSFLEGHGFTYEGSTYGKMSEVLMKAKCMNPIIFFDELDKVSDTRKGEEITGILTHLTDATQNDRFNDRYFSELDMDFSRALFVFSYNDEARINPILKDRMITINAKGYTPTDKVQIAKHYLIPSILTQFGLNAGDIVLVDDAIEQVITRVAAEEGVRNLKRGLESIISSINMLRFLPSQDSEIKVGFPMEVTNKMINKFVVNKQTDIGHMSMYI